MKFYLKVRNSKLEDQKSILDNCLINFSHSLTHLHTMACNKQCQDDILMMADSAAGAFTFITWSVALFQIGKHLKHYTNSYFQNKIISLFFSQSL